MDLFFTLASIKNIQQLQKYFNIKQKMQKTPKYDPINVIFCKNGGHLGFMPIVKNVQACQSDIRRK